MGNLGSIPGLGRSPGEGKGYPLQCSGLENSMDSIVHGVTKSQTQLSNFHFHDILNFRTSQQVGFQGSQFIKLFFYAQENKSSFTALVVLISLLLYFWHTYAGRQLGSSLSSVKLLYKDTFVLQTCENTVTVIIHGFSDHLPICLLTKCILTSNNVCATFQIICRHVQRGERFEQSHVTFLTWRFSSHCTCPFLGVFHAGVSFFFPHFCGFCWGFHDFKWPMSVLMKCCVGFLTTRKIQ